jgi:hypothetical protein
LCPPLAAAQVVRPDPAGIAAVERANKTLTPAQAFVTSEELTRKADTPILKNIQAIDTRFSRQ